MNKGNYFWRVSILGQDGKEIQKSAIQGFTVQKDKLEKPEETKEEEPNYTGPEPIFPLNGESIKSSEGRMKFLWTKKVQETFYRINIFESNSRTLLSSLETTGSGVEFDISKFKTRTELAWQMEVYYRDKQTGNPEKQESRLLQFRIIPSIAPPKIIDPQDIYYLEDKKPKP